MAWIEVGRRLIGAPRGSGGRLTLRLVACGIALLAFAGCSDDSDGSFHLSVRDSAGVQIVTYNSDPGRHSGRVWQLSEEPFLTVGGPFGSPDHELYQVEGATRMTDGRIVAALRAEGALCFFTEEGDVASCSGAQGGGPGEFSGSLGPIALERLAGDTLLAFDALGNRISVFTPTGDFARSRSLSALDGTVLPPLLPVGWLDDGSFVALELRIDGPTTRTSGGTLRRTSVTVLLFDPWGVLVDTLGSFPATERFHKIAGNQFAVRDRPFGREFLADASGTDIVTAVSDSHEIRRYGSDGSLRQILRREGPSSGRPLTKKIVEAWKEERLSGLEDAAARRRSRAWYEAISFPERMPVYEALELDREGRIWVKSYRVPSRSADQPSFWTVFGATGGTVARVEMPPGVEPLEIGEDYLLGVGRDEIDVESLQLFGLERPAAP